MNRKKSLPILILLCWISTISFGQTNVQTALDNLILPTTVKSHLYLSESSDDGNVSFSWSSSNSAIINADHQDGYNNEITTPPGFVQRTNNNEIITLTVTATDGSETDTKDFELTVLANPESNNYVGYLYAYFSSVAGKNEVQQIHFAISDDGITWRDLNENNPVLVSVLGDEGVRDPYIIRSPEGDHFYLIATDLNIYDSKYNNNWGLMATQGSTALMVWESDDLVNWTEQRMVDVASSIDAGNAWAPESIYDEVTGEHLVYWSSLIADDNYSKQRIWLSKTRDFIHFTEPQIFFESSNSNIDASILKTKGQYYLLVKNEEVLSVSLYVSDALLDYNNTTGLGNSFVRIPNDEMESYTGGYEGATMFKFIDEEKWCVLIDEYTGSRRGYIPFLSSDISADNSLELADDGTYLMPTGAKHGTVIPITQTEYDDLMEKWGVQAEYPTAEEGPIAQYTFDSYTSGSSIEDDSDNVNDATLFGNATVVDDAEKGKVLYLDGSSNTYMAMPQGLLDAMDSITISMDVKPYSTENYHFVLGIGQDNYKYGFLRIRSSEVRFATTTESYSKEQDVITNGSFYNQWMNVKLIKAGATTKLYINDVLVDQNDFTRSISDLGSNLLAYLGKSFYSNDPYFRGYFDNVTIYNRSLDESDFPTSVNIKKAGEKADVLIITDPNEDHIVIQPQKVLKQLKTDLYSISGQLVYTSAHSQAKGQIQINTSAFQRGIYLLRVSFDDEFVSQKIIVN
ncbi:LamG-like jellyroll fold domain-containing protein [Carboxylicivirga linearis]|uniref:Family 43 glycosylhydrolase n=1 Tax=Carboxylicivirga linearis TaxID=1628157 RepID=A0ABS5JZ91_9BACT|nr:LamG-like jellyroll fold domain-containing protein [Carboxylicivirga linearis]MBS2100215.1 family 43 glycosylhydrolase [Carboxylicivirga linearis]